MAISDPRAELRQECIRSALLVCASCFLAAHAIAGEADKPEPIQDNSFLIEEGYNQDAGVMQHIGAFWHQRGGQFDFAFIQEFPLGSKLHQLSYIVPGSRTDDNTGVGDVFLNYRYQLVDNDQVAFAPRLSLLLPTGDEDRGLGMGGASVQVSLPLSAQIAPHIVTHTNIGVTYTPRADNGSGDRNDTLGHNLGQSIIWLAHSRFNVLLEAVWFRKETVTGPGARQREDTFLINPGVRWAYDFDNGLQIVPGIAFPIGIGSSRGERGIFFYLSLEHPFRDAH